ncbi:CHAT domain-containing protein [Streptomyces chiangmaiensis]|uniref:CHAT domain-containing protein n=1 Tax=Streptomyces chiangmaiensis TaxID=766497 RepID=A0ABU7FJA4_9ACTN|nr:CHAT domain-containing protein [Streptomyces chiangmaiensis]MED7824202.1 CHAT domain-containing protein [Streptomyces chiangmaiensis]
MIKLLILAANPRDTHPLRLGEEARRIEERIRESNAAGRFNIRSAWAVTVDELLYQLNSFEPNVVHFVGHGEAGQIVLETMSGSSQPLSQEALGTIFSHFRQWLQVVVLNACYSAAQAETLAEQADAVIGMTDRVGDAAAIEFSAGFYRALGFGRSVEDAFSQGVAMLMVRGLADADVPKLMHRTGVDPAKLVLAGASDAAISIRRAEDLRVPERLRNLLQGGCEFLLLSDKAMRLPERHADEENRIFLELGMRQSDAVFVVEVNRFSAVEMAALTLAERLIPTDTHAYDWTLVANGRPLAGSLSLTMAGLRSGDHVKLVGNHREPLWLPRRTGWE